MIDRLIRGPGAIFLVLICYLIWISGMSVPMTGDQKVYLSIALEMKERGEWIIPYLFGRANFLKPPLQYWATLTGWNLLGFGLAGALLPSVAALIGSAFLVRRLSGGKSFLPLLFYCSMISSMTYGTTSQMEIWIVFFYTLAWFFWLHQRRILAWVATGVLSWVKGPLYPALWTGSIVLERFLAKKGRECLRPRFIAGGLLGVLIGISWYLLAARTHLDEVLAVFWMRENLGKLSTPQGSMGGLWAEFLGTLFPLLPWMMLSAGSRQIRQRWKENRTFWLAYGLLPAVFFSLFPYRVNTYLFVLTPLAVWMMGEERPESPRLLRQLVNLLVGLSGVVLLGLVFRLHAGHWISSVILVAAVVGLGIWAYGHLRLSPAAVGVGSLFLVTVIRLAAIEIGEWDLKALRTYRSLNPGPIAYLIDHEDIWHEFGLVSAALESPIAR
ncbi:MAG: hypothetical protein EBX52_02090, partial [Proteobacteria bacterium]|nr:hypothetical protein [Pseudomonadota bacterium]